MDKEISIYIHIPFCASRCYYCDFCSTDKIDNKLVQRYIDAVIKEILNNAEILSEYKIKTIYFGGGTPSYIDEKYIAKILEVLNLFNLKENKEITIELNPADCKYEKLQNYVNMGINRYSLGVQSANDDILRVIGRRHTKATVTEAYNNMVKAGISNISVDLITGLPNDTVQEFLNTLSFISSLGDEIKHISTYSLEVHEGTKLATLIDTGFVTLPSEDDERKMNDLVGTTLEKKGYNMYEISNYAKEGYESKHNLTYWNQEYYLGFGVSAASYINGKRYSNINNINEYIDGINNFKSVIKESSDLDKLDTIKEYIILKLRLIKGVNIHDFYSKFKVNLFDIFKEEINDLIDKELLIKQEDNIFLTHKGRDIANVVWEKFI